MGLQMECNLRWKDMRTDFIASHGRPLNQSRLAHFPMAHPPFPPSPSPSHAAVPWASNAHDGIHTPMCRELFAPIVNVVEGDLANSLQV